MQELSAPTRTLILVVSVGFFLIVFGTPIILIAGFGSSYVDAKYYSYFGRAYPLNHVYQVLLVANKKRLMPREGNGDTYNDVTDEFRQLTAGETFSELIKEFGELGNSAVHDVQKKAVSKYVSGQEYLLELNDNQLSVLRIPDSTFGADRVFDTITFSVKIKYSSDSQYKVLEAKSHEKETPL